jgi:hypothetical protein
MLVAAMPLQAEDPPLPAGLGAAPAAEEPALPAGLGGAPEEPALPAGLGGAPEEPALPAGLGESGAMDEPESADAAGWRERLGFPLHGFWETRGALRVWDDPAQSKSMTLGETRLQLRSEHTLGGAFFEWRADTILDGVREEADFDLREARLSFTIGNDVDVRVGRQILTWGTGDLLFINDLFPKDWQSFLSGREVEYLKAPSDALRVGWYPGPVNVEVVYTPRFAPDRFITGERISWYDPLFDRHNGASRELNYNAPSDWFSEDEWAARVYRRAGNWEVAAYGYWGYWKSPGGQQIIPFMQAKFPKLEVYGASARGPLGRGIFSAEMGYYNSRQDTRGADRFVNNSEFRALAGYEQELAKDFTGGVQLYWEHMMDYGAYRRTLPWLIEPRDQDRVVVTVRLTKLLMQQNLVLSWFAYYSPTDQDAFLLPKATYKVDDHWTVEGGANIFLGRDDHTFFGQFERNTSVYLGARYSF